jgi:hypothetical protein
MSCWRDCNSLLLLDRQPRDRIGGGDATSQSGVKLTIAGTYVSQSGLL